MLNDKFRLSLEEFHVRRWFPDVYPDPAGEFIDSLTDETVSQYLEGHPYIAYYLHRIIPAVLYRNQWWNYRNAVSQPVGETKKPPAWAGYYIRSLPGSESDQHWRALQGWCTEWQTLLREWLEVQISYERRWEKLQLEVPPREAMLTESLDFFRWHLSRHTDAVSLPGLLRSFRLDAWDEIADWTDLPSLGKSFTETCRFQKLPKRKKAPEEAVQFVFPILPPRRVQLQYGKTAGAVDALRFAMELGKGVFYAGMNPDMRVESRICGDPALPWFWGHLYANTLTTRAGLSRLVNQRAEDLADTLRFVLQFWFRNEAMLSVYRANTEPALKTARDLYVHLWEQSFPLECPSFLFLYDLDRSFEAVFRYRAFLCAIAAEEKLRLLYGTDWFASSAFARRARDYWWEGFQLKLADVINDLGVSIPTHYPFL